MKTGRALLLCSSAAKEKTPYKNREPKPWSLGLQYGIKVVEVCMVKNTKHVVCTVHGHRKLLKPRFWDIFVASLKYWLSGNSIGRKACLDSGQIQGLSLYPACAKSSTVAMIRIV